MTAAAATAVGQVSSSGATGTTTVVLSNTTAIGTVMTGGAGVDNFTGTGGNDIITGAAGADVLVGGSGADTLSGGDGVDDLTGGAGIDSITSGAGADVIRFGIADTDTVSDFTVAAGGDIIDVSDAGNDALGALVAQVADGTTAAVAHADNTILFLTAATFAAYDTQAEVAAAFGAGAEFAAMVASDRNTLIISATDTGASYVWSLRESGANTSIADAGDTVVLVGILSGISAAAAATMVAGNFQA